MEINLSIDPVLQRKLTERGIESSVFDSVLNHVERRTMLETWFGFCSEWFLPDGQDATVYKSVSLGGAIFDDMLLLLVQCYHVAHVLDYCHSRNIRVRFFQSRSCQFPEHIVDVLSSLEVELVTTDDSYHQLCYRNAHKREAFNRVNYSGIVYDLYSDTSRLSAIRPAIRQGIQRIINRPGRFYTPGSESILIRPMRRLITGARNLVVGNKTKEEIYVRFPESNLASLLNLAPSEYPYSKTDLLKEAERRGMKPSFSRRAVAPVRALGQGGFQQAFSEAGEYSGWLEHAQRLTGLKNVRYAKAFCQEVFRFFLGHKSKLKRQVRRRTSQVAENGRSLRISEYLNPIDTQLACLAGNTTVFVHLSRILNNQYFCPSVLERYSNSVFVCVSSAFEKERIIRQGISSDKIVDVSEADYYGSFIMRDMPDVTVADTPFLEGKTVLVIPPPMRVIWTIRLMMDSSSHRSYFQELYPVLRRAGVSKIILRPTVGAGEEINDVGSTLSDVHDEVFAVSTELQDSELKIDMEPTCLLRTSKNMVSISDDLADVDLVVGTLSACAIDAALCGLDYIVFDRSVIPFPDSLNYSIFSSDSPLRMFSDPKQLQNHLLDYQPEGGSPLREFLIPIVSTKVGEENIDLNDLSTIKDRVL